MASFFNPARTAGDPELSAERAALQSRRCLLNVGRWARRQPARPHDDEIRDLVDMLGLDVEAARHG